MWIANFIFTRCPGVCPLLTARMAKLQQELEKREENSVRFLSFSVDPKWDTPERLRQYAQRHGADPEKWFFLTGELKDLQRLIQRGFRLSAVRMPPRDPQASDTPVIAHSDRFVLIDPRGRIRGYYLGNEKGVLEHILRDVETLRRELT